MNKPASKQIEVQIMGQSYLLACPTGGESSLLDAVERVDTGSGIEQPQRVRSVELRGQGHDDRVNVLAVEDFLVVHSDAGVFRSEALRSYKVHIGHGIERAQTF